MDRDDTEDHHGFSKSYEASQRVIREAKSAVVHAVEGLNRWVRRRGRFGQLLVGAILSVLVHRIVIVVESLAPSVVAGLFLITRNQLLAAIVGVIFGQTLVQIRKFNQIWDELEAMDNQPSLRADGGEHTTRTDESDKSVGFLKGTSGGGLAGGAIVGAALGSSLGPGGTAGGAVFGAVLGDVIEQTANKR